MTTPDPNALAADVAGLARRVLHDKVHEEARKRHLNDATQEGYEHHVVVVAAEHGAALALRASHPTHEPAGEVVEALRWADLHKDDQDMNHVNYRIGAGSRAAAALALIPELRAARERERALLERAKDFVDRAPKFDWNEDRCIMTAVHLAGDISAALHPTAREGDSA